MATKKVIIKRQEDRFQWSQTDESLTIYLPVKNVLLKNIDVLITSDFLKVNAPSIRYVEVIDFAYPIDYEHLSNKVTLLDDKLEVVVHKAEPKSWEKVVVTDLTKEQIRARRDESLKQYYARQDEREKAAREVKLQQDKHSIDQQMKVEGYQRKQIKQKKEEEKKQAENELYRDLDEMEHRNQMLIEQKQK